MKDYKIEIYKLEKSIKDLNIKMQRNHGKENYREQFIEDLKKLREYTDLYTEVVKYAILNGDFVFQSDIH